MSVLSSSLTFQQLAADGVLSPIHQAFGETLQRLDAAASPDVLLAAVLCSEQLSRGHVCLDLSAARSIMFPISDADSRFRQYDNWPDESEWIEHLQNSPLVTTVLPGTELVAASTPLVLDVPQRRLYLARYWYFEQRLTASIAERLNQAPLQLAKSVIERELAKLFPDQDYAGSRDQCLAVANSVDRWFSIITGGPGTGKTTTVATLLALRLLQHQAAGNDPSELKILLMAPTGKAAQRLNESLDRATQRLEVDTRVQEALSQVSAGTIHRLLGWTPLPPERGGPFRHRAEVPLEADIVLVDEASMVDLALMCRLFDAIPLTAQVILIGDRDQLASVQAGGVLSDLCGSLPDGTLERLSSQRRSIISRRSGIQDSLIEFSGTSDRQTGKTSESKKRKKSAQQKKKSNPRQMTLSFEPESASKVNLTRQANTSSDTQQPDDSVSPLAATFLTESVSRLNYSHRFSAESSLGQLAAAIRDGQADDAISLLRDANSAEIQWLDGNANAVSPVERAIDLAAEGYADYLNQLRREPTGSIEILQAASQVRVLTAHRSGLRGESSLNQRIADRLIADGMLRPYLGDSFGRLVMVARNDYRLDLFNGDVGVVVEAEAASASGRSRVIIFEDGREESGIRRVPTALVPGVQDCFAMTIHRSQGSEFRQVLLVLPENDSPVLSRELLYTAVTRVKDSVDPASGQSLPGFLGIVGSESVLRGAISRRIFRVSGLHEGVESRLRSMS